MKFNTITGAFIFQGQEADDCELWLWATLISQSWKSKIEIIVRMIFCRIPKRIKYETPEVYEKRSYEELLKLKDGGKV